MITVCKNCRSALDETMETCRDCGLPNPWFDQGATSEVANPGSHLERTLLVLGALYVSFAPLALLILSVTPWSRLPVTTRLFYPGSFILGLGDLAVAMYCDLERPMWRRLAKGLVVVNLLAFALASGLDRAGWL